MVPVGALAFAVLAVIVVAALGLSELVPSVNAVLWAMVLGLVLAPATQRRPGSALPIKATGSMLLRLGVALLGLRISVGDLAGLGARGAVIAGLTVLVTMLLTQAVGRRFGVDRNLALLIATGTAVCGASAVAAMASAVNSREEDVAYALATVTLFGTLAMIGLPLAGVHLLGLDERALGVWLGASIHEVAQVAGAGAAVSLVALQTATLIKLARVVLLAPAVAATALTRRAAGETMDAGRAPLVPWFVVAFLALVAVRSLVPLSPAVIDAATALSGALLAAGLAALGLQMQLGQLRQAGLRPMALGLWASLCAAAVALLLVLVIGT